MRTVELTPRLRSVAELVPRGARFADVGTDHAYLPVWLLQQGRITGAVASDLRPGPLERARGTAEKYGLTGRMDFRLCDGLSGIQPDEVNTIAIAGMGGETIAAILAAAPWTWERECLLLLQPMSAQPFLRRWLQAHGYTIRRELLSRESLVMQKKSNKSKKGYTEVDLIPLIKGFNLECQSDTLTLDAVLCAQNPGLNPELIRAAFCQAYPEYAPDFVTFHRREVLDIDGKPFR